MLKNKSNLFVLLTLGTFYLIVFILFRNIRALFPPPEIYSNKIVGYSQYFGYPFYFDNILFWAILVVTFFAPFTLKLWKKKKRGK